MTEPVPYPFDPGPVAEPFLTLCGDYPGPDVYPPADFRVEWGPIFHRGRLDGSARLLIIGQDPGQHECIARRILVGEAGQRIQGFLARLGLERSYVMVNAFIYSVYGQAGGERHKFDPAIAAYRQRWLDALLGTGQIQAVVTLGHLAREAYEAWTETATGIAQPVPHVAMLHPTYPDSAAAHGQTTLAEATARLLRNWNQALQFLRPLVRPDVERDLVLYRNTLAASDLAMVPAADLPAGSPPWMRSLEQWAARVGDTPEEKRATIVVTVPAAERPWSSPG